MRKVVLLFVLFIFTISLMADDFMQPLLREGMESDRSPVRIFENPYRDVPNYEFITDPSMIITSFFDYMPGSYNSYPLRVQSDGEGMYVVFHARETAASTRRIYYAYIDGDGNVLNVATIGTEDLHEGYCGIDIDPITNDPIVAWHKTYTGGPIAWKVVSSYDLYHLGSPGLWKTPFTIVDETIPTPYADDVFIWPYIYIGPSPEVDKRRVYVVSNNQVSHQPSGNPSENVLIGYADFNEGDFNVQSELTWTWNTIPMLDGWNAGTPEETRPNQAFNVSEDGKVAYMGYSSAPEGSTVGDQLYVFYNDNYGDGDYEFISVPADHDIENPLNQDGTYRFVDPDTGAPLDLFMEPYLCNHANTIFADDNSKIMFLGNMNIMIRPTSWWPDRKMMYLKLYTFDIETETFSFQDFVDLPGAYPHNDTPVLPWDIDEDGLVDEFDPDGYVTWVSGHPIYFDVSDDMFHENNTKLTKNNDNDWIVAVWQDGLKNRFALEGEPAYAGWEEKAEIKIALSANNGIDWSEPITMNAKTDDDNYVPQLDGMMPCYIYPSDKIIDLGDGHGKLDIFFYDDFSFGSYSSPSGHGQNLGGELTYMSLDLDFNGLPTFSVDNTIVASIANMHQNYPNPFNPSTTIRYSLKEDAEIKINVYNVKGQKVKTLINEQVTAGSHTITWNGKNESNTEIASGVYFYEMRIDESDYTSIKKMLLLK